MNLRHCCLGLRKTINKYYIDSLVHTKACIKIRIWKEYLSVVRIVPVKQWNTCRWRRVVKLNYLNGILRKRYWLVLNNGLKWPQLTQIPREHEVDRVSFYFDQVLHFLEIVKEYFSDLLFVLTQLWHVTKRIVLRARDDFLVHNKGWL